MWIVKVAFQLNGRWYQPGNTLTLGELGPAVQSLLASGRIEEEPSDEPYSTEYGLALQDFTWKGQRYVAGQWVPLADIDDPELLFRTNYLWRVRESDPFKKGQSFACFKKSCKAFFATTVARRRHVELTGHKRKVQAKKK